jgi:hypothetical protein
VSDHRNEVALGLGGVTFGGDVVHDQDTSHRSTRNAYVGHPHLVGARGIAGDDFALHLALGLEELLDLFVSERSLHRRAGRERAGYREDLFGRRVHSDDLAAGVHEHDRVRHAVEDRRDLALLAFDLAVDLGGSDRGVALLAEGLHQVTTVVDQIRVGGADDDTARAFRRP